MRALLQISGGEGGVRLEYEKESERGLEEGKDGEGF